MDQELVGGARVHERGEQPAAALIQISFPGSARRRAVKSSAGSVTNSTPATDSAGGSDAADTAEGQRFVERSAAPEYGIDAAEELAHAIISGRALPVKPIDAAIAARGRI